MNTDNQSEKKGGGFSGLSSMVSSVEIPEQTNVSNSEEKKKVAPTSQVHSEARVANDTPLINETTSGTESKGKWVLIGVGVIILLIVLSNSGSKKSEPAYNPSYTPSYTQTPELPATPALPSIVVSESDLLPTESVPPVGTNQVLNSQQITYCVAESFRLEGARDASNSYLDSHVTRFNQMVGDYNSRCSEYRYRQGTLESVKSEVGKFKESYIAAGRVRFQGSNSSVATKPEPNLNFVPLTQDAAVKPSSIEHSSNRENFQTCISGEYPVLCKHNLLTASEAAQVREAERAANYRTCISGEYPVLCKRNLLTSSEAQLVDKAERQVNYQTCVSGEYPVLCRHELLTTEQAATVRSAELRANYNTCISGDYPILCKHSLLTPEQARQVSEAERRARRNY